MSRASLGEVYTAARPVSFGPRHLTSIANVHVGWGEGARTGEREGATGWQI